MNGNGRGGIRFRAWLYLGAAVVPVAVEKVGPVLTKNEWPSWPLLVFTVLCMSGVGFVTLRAYYDGSAQRHEDEQKKDEQKKLDTSFFANQKPPEPLKT